MKRRNKRFPSGPALAGALAFGLVMNAPTMANADEGGVTMWVPGFFGSLAAAPLQPGWALGTIYYHPSVDASGNVATARQITIGRFNPNLDLSLSASLQARPDLLLVVPSYVFATPVLGGQAAVVFLQGWGRSEASIDATLTAILGPLSAVRSVSISDSRYGFSDFGAQGNLRWNFGVHNFMTYVAANAPTGTYDATRLANFGIGHWAVDAGGGYTYFNPQTGHELSAVLGFTYNFRNPYTDYQNGVSMHIDWGASQFLSKQFHVGLVGYWYNQLTADIGAAPILGEFKSRVAGIGPQAGYLFPVGDLQGYLNLKGYWEFDAQNRAEGWNLWLTFSISPAPPSETLPKVSSIRK
jgi:hypothetical protein